MTCANVCIARLIFHRQFWIGLVGGGIALGLAFLSKGPVAFLMSVVPAMIFVLWRRNIGRDDLINSSASKLNRWHVFTDAIIHDIVNAEMKPIPPELAIYMNRPFERIEEIASIPQSDRPQFYVDRQRRNGPEIQPARGWRELMRTPRDSDLWVVCVRE